MSRYKRYLAPLATVRPWWMVTSSTCMLKIKIIKMEKSEKLVIQVLCLSRNKTTNHNSSYGLSNEIPQVLPSGTMHQCLFMVIKSSWTNLHKLRILLHVAMGLRWHWLGKFEIITFKKLCLMYRLRYKDTH